MLAELYLARCRRRFEAYTQLQLHLMQCFIRRGGSAEAWCGRYAAAFRRRYGWMLDAAR